MKSARSLEVTKCRDLRKFYNLREPKEGEVITYDRWYYLTYGIIDGLNYESKLAESIKRSVDPFGAKRQINLQTNPTQPHSRIS